MLDICWTAYSKILSDSLIKHCDLLKPIDRNQFRILVHTVKDTEKAKDGLLKAAIRDSRHKAEILAEAAGTALGDIITIDYSWGVIDFVTRPMNRLAEPARAYGAVMEDSYEMDIEPEDIVVEDTVTVVWGLFGKD